LLAVGVAAVRDFIGKLLAAARVVYYRAQHLLLPAPHIHLQLALVGQRQQMDQTQLPFL
jgi:hypothetical protein